MSKTFRAASITGSVPKPAKVISGQSAIETLLMMGVIIAFILPLLLLFFSSSAEKVSSLERLQARALSQILSDTAGSVWYNGNGSRTMLLVEVPNNLVGINLSGDYVNDSDLLTRGHEITLSYLSPGSGVQDMVMFSPAPVRSLPPAIDVRNQSKLEQHTLGPKSVLRSGLVVLIFQNNGTYVNILRKVNGKVE